MAFRRTAIAFVAIALAATQARASDDQSIETFDSRSIGSSALSIHNDAFMFDTKLSGGEVVAATSGHPAYSGMQFYGGKSITLVTEDEDQFAWPGVGAWVSGSETIRLQAYEFHTETGTDEPLDPIEISGDGTYHYLSIGSVFPHLNITKAVFSSDSDFALDDLTLGIEGVSPAIPEPGSWAMLVCGLGLVGGAMRAGRKRRASIA